MGFVRYQAEQTLTKLPELPRLKIYPGFNQVDHWRRMGGEAANTLWTEFPETREHADAGSLVYFQYDLDPKIRSAPIDDHLRAAREGFAARWTRLVMESKA